MTQVAAYRHNGELVARDAFYAIACDPRRSVAVQACAGAGKTWMLVSRILRALLEEGEAACQPQEILAITFTKKAAGEMRQRLDEWLEAFANQPPERLIPELVARGMGAAQAAAAAPRLSGLLGRLLQEGRPVQFRTFHAWFAGLLRNAPLALLARLRLPANYQLLEDDAQARARSWRPFYAALAADARARADYEALVATHGRSQAAKALAEALERRTEFVLADEQGVVEAGVQPVGALFPAYAGADDPASVLFDTPALRDALWAAARALGQASAPTFSAKGGELAQALTARQAQGVLDALLTQKGEPRKFSEKLAGLAQVRLAQDHAMAHAAAQAQHEAWLYQQRLMRLARRLIAAYEGVKQAHAWVDMNDVERAARLLLGEPELWGWVLERLDAGVRHLLIDEFQDTNPLQWQALYGWLGSYAGAGGGGKGRPGIFIVGDPKQSIYRFRGAEPQVFMAAQQYVRAGLGGDLLQCDHTRRNAQAVIATVNAAMQAASAAGEAPGFRVHTTESAQLGRVARLPHIERPDRVDAPVDDSTPIWRDSLTMPRVLPEEKLLQLEARQAARWIARCIADGLAPKQVMVLARKRNRLTLLQEELSRLCVPAQQPEKNDLHAAPEVQDVVALLDALVSPCHSLSLARALKSPLFGLDDEALVALALRQRAAPQAAPSWFDILQQSADLPPALAGIGERLRGWQVLVDALPPHDALSAIYRQADVLPRFAAAVPAALRPTVLANLRGLLAASLELDGARFATPYAFVRALRAGRLQAPAVAAADAVQLLTVHGAKGLEAELVLLLDCDAPAQRAQTMGVLVDWPGQAAAPRRFVFLASEKNPPACAAELLAREQAERQREEINALYVATTRSREELVLSAVAAARSNPLSWWMRLEGLADPIEAVGRQVMDELPAQAGMVSSNAAFSMRGMPPVPLCAMAPAMQAHAAADASAGTHAALGQAMHRLLEWAQPGESLPAAHVRAAGREFGLTATQARGAAVLAQRIRGGAGAWAWDTQALDWQGNELSLTHEGAVLRIDRLVRRRDGTWWVLDYKSAAHPQQDESLVAQLARYRDAVQQACPGETVRAAFLTGQGELVEIA